MPVAPSSFAAVREESLVRRGSTPMMRTACSAGGESLKRSVSWARQTAGTIKGRSAEKVSATWTRRFLVRMMTIASWGHCSFGLLSGQAPGIAFTDQRISCRGHAGFQQPVFRVSQDPLIDETLYEKDLRGRS